MYAEIVTRQGFLFLSPQYTSGITTQTPFKHTPNLTAIMELNLLNQEEIATLRNLLSNATNIVICAHKSPDGDATGSSLAWMHFLNQIGKTNVKVCMPDATPDFLHWLPGHNSVIRYDRRPKEVEKAFKEADLVCCLDFNQNSRVDAMQEVLESSTAPRLLNLLWSSVITNNGIMSWKPMQEVGCSVRHTYLDIGLTNLI